VATIDRRDRQFILNMNNVAASYRKLAEVSSPPVRDYYVLELGRYTAFTESAVEAAMRRAA